MDLSGADHLERAVTELGEPEDLFHISRGRFLAKLGLGVLLVLIGIVANYLWWFQGPAAFDHFIFHLLYLVPLFGVALLIHMYRNRGLFVLVYPNGLLRLRHGEVDSFPWHEIESIRLRLTRAEGAEFTYDPDGSLLACWLPVDVPTFKLWDAGFTVIRTDGAEAHFGPALTDYEGLATEVQKRTFTALWRPLRTRFRNREHILFGELDVGPVGLSHAGKLLTWRELKELTIAQGKLSIKQSGKWLPWALLDLSGVPNPHLLFALAEEARRSPLPPPPSEPKLPIIKQQQTDDGW